MQLPTLVGTPVYFVSGIVLTYCEKKLLLEVSIRSYYYYEPSKSWLEQIIGIQKTTGTFRKCENLPVNHFLDFCTAKLLSAKNHRKSYWHTNKETVSLHNSQTLCQIFFLQNRCLEGLISRIQWCLYVNKVQRNPQ